MLASVISLIDGSGPSESALDAAARLAVRASLSLHGLFIEDERQFTYFPPVTAMGVGLGTAPTVAVPLPADEYARVEREVRGLRERAEESFQRRCAAHDIHGRFQSTRGDVIDEMIVAARRNGLVVMGCRRRGAPEGATNPGSKIEPLLRATPRPLLLTPEGTWMDEAGGTVMLAYDGSTAALRALPLAGWMAQLFGSSVEVVVVEDDKERLQLLHEEAFAYLEPYGMEITQTSQSGRAWKRLVHLAEQRQTRCMVMGAFGHYRISEWIFGSTTTNVLEHLPCPVLLTRP